MQQPWKKSKPSSAKFWGFDRLRWEYLEPGPVLPGGGSGSPRPLCLLPPEAKLFPSTFNVGRSMLNVRLPLLNPSSRLCIPWRPPRLGGSDFFPKASTLTERRYKPFKIQNPTFKIPLLPRPLAASAPRRFKPQTGMVGTRWGRNPFDGQSAECAYLCMRTTIELPDGLFRQVKTLAVQKGLTLKEFFTAAVERAVVEPPPESRRMLRPPIGGVEGRPIPARNNQELAALLEAEDPENLQ